MTHWIEDQAHGSTFASSLVPASWLLPPVTPAVRWASARQARLPQTRWPRSPVLRAAWEPRGHGGEELWLWSEKAGLVFRLHPPWARGTATFFIWGSRPRPGEREGEGARADAVGSPLALPQTSTSFPSRSQARNSPELHGTASLGFWEGKEGESRMRLQASVDSPVRQDCDSVSLAHSPRSHFIRTSCGSAGKPFTSKAELFTHCPCPFPRRARHTDR